MELNPATSYRAVLIGIDDYPQKPLSGCVNDIDQIESILLDRLGVPPERITRFAAPRAGASASTRLPSLSPTLEGLRNCLNRLAEEVGKERPRLPYYSGHGSQTMTRWNGQHHRPRGPAPPGQRGRKPLGADALLGTGIDVALQNPLAGRETGGSRGGSAESRRAGRGGLHGPTRQARVIRMADANQKIFLVMSVPFLVN